MGPAEVAAFAAGHPGGKPWVVLDACDEDERKRVAWLKAYVRAWELAGKPSRTREVLEPIIAAAAAEH